MAKIAIVDITFLAYEYNFGAVASLLADHGHEVMAFYDSQDAPRDKRIRFAPCCWTGTGITPLVRFDPDKVLVFNGSHPQRYAATRLFETKWPVIYAENGWLPQADNIYLDPEGVNSRSSIFKNPYLPRRSPEFISEVKSTVAELKKLFVPNPLADEMPKDYILVPLQLEQDTSIVQDSPYFKSMRSFVQYILWHFCDHPIVIKPHPKDHTEWKFDNVLVADKKISMNDLVPGAKLVVGINSTSLIEALVHYKPVAALGRNVASNKGVYVAECHDMFLGNPRACLEKTPDPARIDEVLHYLCNIQFPRKKPPTSVLKLFA